MHIESESKEESDDEVQESEKNNEENADDTVEENQLNDKQTNWLRDIKYRYFPQPKQEWKPSDEQIDVLESLIENRSIERRHLVSLYEQLKKLTKE